MKSSVRTQSRGGFTLLEILISTGLMVLLMTIVYGVMDSYFQLSTLGRLEAERAQIARAVFDRISVDLRSVRFEPEEEETTEGEDAEGEDAVEIEPDLSSVSADDAFAYGIIGLAGTESELVLYTARPTRDAALEAIVDGVDPENPVNELQIVCYLNVGQTSSVLGELVARDSGDLQTFSSMRGVEAEGLARVWGDAVEIREAGEGADPIALAKDFQLLAPEIIHLRFSYLDAGEETDVWDTRQTNRLPQSVRVEIGFRPQPSPRDEDNNKIDMDTPVKIYSKVISLPLSEPYVDELAL